MKKGVLNQWEKDFSAHLQAAFPWAENQPIFKWEGDS